MNATNYFKPLDLSSQFLDNINNQVEQNNNETNLHIYENKNLTSLPPIALT